MKAIPLPERFNGRLVSDSKPEPCALLHPIQPAPLIEADQSTCRGATRIASVPSIRPRRSLATVLIFLWLGLTACSADSDTDAFVVDEPIAPQSEAVNLTVEEASFLASGQLFETYGAVGDPIATSIQSEAVQLDGQQVWQLDLTVDVTVEEEREQHNWTMWVGTSTDGEPTVLRARRQTE